MLNVDVDISGIIMCCDESLCGLSLGRGYTIEKRALETLSFKDKITNGKGFLNTDYFESRIIENEEVFFICLNKSDAIQIERPLFSASKCEVADEEYMDIDEFAQYTDNEIEYLNERINLLRLFKSGNIGFREVFFRYSFKAMGLIKYNLNHTSLNEARNTIACEKFTLSEQEINSCNKWLEDYSDEPYALLKKSIEEFSHGLEQIDVPTRFEQYTTALEMILLPQNQPGKKQMLANRISAMLGITPTEIQRIYNKIIDFYRFRSESLHEGNGSNITTSELHELENITREVLKKSLMRCKTEYDLNPCVTWKEIKAMIMNDLKAKVTSLKNSGVLPA